MQVAVCCQWFPIMFWLEPSFLTRSGVCSRVWSDNITFELETTTTCGGVWFINNWDVRHIVVRLEDLLSLVPGNVNDPRRTIPVTIRPTSDHPNVQPVSCPQGYASWIFRRKLNSDGKLSSTNHLEDLLCVVVNTTCKNSALSHTESVGWFVLQIKSLVARSIVVLVVATCRIRFY